MMSSLPVVRWLNGEPKHRMGLALFQRAIGLSLVFRVITEGPFASFLWGPQSLATDGAVVRWFGPLGGRADLLFSTMGGTYLLLAVVFAAGSGLLFQRFTRLSAIVACLTFNILGARLPELNDGGDNLATLSLFYMMFVLPAGTGALAGSIRAWVHNLGAVAICLQVCIVYFVAGFMKMNGDSWHNGTALYLISQVEWFSSPGTRAWFAHPLIATSAAYATMFFQVWFPIALFSRLKLAFLALAMLFHIGIAVTMGLLTFSVVMAGADLSLMTDSEFEWLRDKWHQLRTTVQSGWHRRTAPAILFMDGQCAVCRRFATRTRQLVATERVTIRSFHESEDYLLYGIAREQLQGRMHLVVPGQSFVVSSGFDVLLALAWRSPLLWWAIPVLSIGKHLGIGAVAYDAFAVRRHLFAGPACDDRCSLP